MAKLTPWKRWQKEVLERYKALQYSGEIERLQAEGLAVLNRTYPMSAQEWWHTSSERMASPEYLRWCEQCRQVGERYGLARWTVEMACLLDGFDPATCGLVLEADWPKALVVTSSTNSAFLEHLAWHAQQLGLHAVQRTGSIETTILNLDCGLSTPLAKEDRPPGRNALTVRIEVPSDYPSEAAKELQQKVLALEKELRRRLGYHVRERLRSSPLIDIAEELKPNETPLPLGGAYDIIDNTYHDEDVSHDQARRKTTGSRRHRIRKRLTETYEE